MTSIAVWVLLLYGGSGSNTPAVIDNIASEKQCRDLGKVVQETNEISKDGINYYRYETYKCIPVKKILR